MRALDGSFPDISVMGGAHPRCRNRNGRIARF